MLLASIYVLSRGTAHQLGAGDIDVKKRRNYPEKTSAKRSGERQEEH